MASTSSIWVISSMAMTCGFMPRSRMDTAAALPHPSRMSVCRPTYIWGAPCHMAAISPRSSATARRNGGAATPSDSPRTRSRSKVVFPAPGGAKISVFCSRSPSISWGSRASACPTTGRAMRTDREEISRKVATFPSRTTAAPQMPMRCPPRRVRNPRCTWSSTVWAEAWLACSSTCRSSSPVTTSSPTSCSPSPSNTVGRNP